MRRRHVINLVFFLGVVLTALVVTRNDRPLLGLDLQGGVAVVLQPKGNPTTEAVEQAKNIINQRVDALGVAEPDIVRQGKTIVVQLPGVKDRDKALAIIGRTAKLEFRPVLQNQMPGYTYDAKKAAAGELPCVATTTTASTVVVPTTATGSSTTAPVSTTAPASSTTVAAGKDESGLAPVGAPPEGETAAGVLTQADPSTTAPATTVPATTAPPATASSVPTSVAGSGDIVVYPDRESRICMQLGPVAFEGSSLSSAQAEINTEWQVNVKIRGKDQAKANQHMNACFNGDATCPTKQSAIVLDREVVSAPTVNAADLASSPQGFVISGNFTASEAKDLALVLKYGALPVEFKKDVNVQEVSATLGKDSLHAGLVSGMVGLALVVIYVVAYYRLLGVVAVLSLLCGAGLLWAVIAYLGEHNGLALTLAGITGIIVSIGIAVDSNVVFYEHLREDIHKGRTFRSVVNGSFTSAWRTIIAADLVSLIAAFLLWLLTVGAVRGFAFYLGLSTVLDLVASYFLMRPLVMIMSRSDWLVAHPKLLGLDPPPSQEGASA